MHSEIYFNEADILALFDNFLEELDIIFYKSIGSEYKTISGYSDLKENFDKYQELATNEQLKLKSKVIKRFLEIFDEVELGIGEKDVLMISDINKATKIFSKLFESDFNFGTDVYNMFCSGNVASIKRFDDERFVLFTKDNQSEYIFKFKSLIIYIPEIEEQSSPLIFIESAEDKIEPDLEKFVVNHSPTENIREIKYLSGVNFIEENRMTFDGDEINELYQNIEYDDSFQIPEYYNIYRFYTEGIFCFLNIQALLYSKQNKYLVYNHNDLKGKELQVKIRQSLN